jgi:hypothetical protein
MCFIQDTYNYIAADYNSYKKKHCSRLIEEQEKDLIAPDAENHHLMYN